MGFLVGVLVGFLVDNVGRMDGLKVGGRVAGNPVGDSEGVNVVAIVGLPVASVGRRLGAIVVDVIVGELVTCTGRAVVAVADGMTVVALTDGVKVVAVADGAAVVCGNVGLELGVFVGAVVCVAVG